MEKKLGKYSLGIGDRFEHQGIYQLSAIQDALKLGVEITPAGTDQSGKTTGCRRHR